MNCAEFNKLVKLLDEANIPYERNDSHIAESSSFDIYRIHYPKDQNFVCSCIFGRGTYGSYEGLLEIMGLLTPEESEHGSVVGFLTAENVFERIRKHWEEVQKNEKGEKHGKD